MLLLYGPKENIVKIQLREVLIILTTTPQHYSFLKANGLNSLPP